MATGFVPRIDVHHHLIPPAFGQAFAAHGLTTVAGAPLPRWTPDRSLSVMDENGIATAILSLSAPGVHFGSEEEASALARDCNEYAAGLAARHPGRFGFFAVLPMPDADRAAREAAYALDVLNADGIVLLGSTRGVFLGDPSLDELMAELDRRAAVVFVHPNVHATSETLSLAAPQFFVEFVCDTTRAATNLVFTGTLERFPNIRFILAHAGGFLPYIAWRLSLGNLIPAIAERAPAGILEYLRRFYFDTALSPSPFAMAALGRLVDLSHILFGSDFPFAPEPMTASQVGSLDGLADWDEAMRSGVARGHALALFPRFAGAGEAPPASASAFSPRSVVARMRGAALRSVVHLVDHIRNQ
jgi:predicted TIM-barrel fold metal-dependent hydrolase